MNIFTYAARCEAMFENYLREASGYERKTTFYSDLSIAEVFGQKAIKDTYRRVIKKWMDNIEYITEFVMAVNIKAWEHHDRGNLELSKLYSTLYHDSYAKVAEHFEGNEEAISYFFNTID